MNTIGDEKRLYTDLLPEYQRNDKNMYDSVKSDQCQSKRSRPSNNYTELLGGKARVGQHMYDELTVNGTSRQAVKHVDQNDLYTVCD